jgi:protein Tex
MNYFDFETTSILLEEKRGEE